MAKDDYNDVTLLKSALINQKTDEIDMIEIQKIEDKIISERDRLVSTLRSLGNAVIATDINANVVLVNRMAEALIGWTEQEAIGKTLRDVFPITKWLSQESYEQNVQRILVEGKKFEFANHSIMIDRYGKNRIITGDAVPIYDENGNAIGIVVSLQDITKKCKTEEEMMERQKFEPLGVLASGIAHDFNNILTAILGNISLAKIDLNPKDMLERLTETEKALNRAKYLTQQLLNFSKNGLPDRAPSSISELLKDSVNSILSGSNIKCQFDFPDGIWMVGMDERQISQVIINIIINAVQAMPKGGMLKIYDCNVNLKEGEIPPLNMGCYVRISIEDHGTGISKEDLERIFDPYFTTKKEGSGLGLAVSLSIIRNHNGHITVDSQVGVGTTFHVYLPALPEKDLAKKKKDQPVKRRILVLDDDELIRELIETILGNFGYEVITVADGTEAIESYESARRSERPFDAVIMDLTIPGGMGAKEAIDVLTQLDPDVKAIVSSGYSNDPIINDFDNYGFKGVIIKPYGIKELSKVINNVIMG